MTDDALSADTDEGLREAHRAILELKREVKELREDMAPGNNPEADWLYLQSWPNPLI